MNNDERRILIIGANSDVALALLPLLHANGHPLLLTSRDRERLQGRVDALALPGPEITTMTLDISDMTAAEAFWQGHAESIQGVFIFAGLMPQQADASGSSELSKQVWATNFTGPARFAELAAATFAERGLGFICALSSVAGERGRAANYTYGSAKAGFSAFLSGLRNRYDRQGVKVITVIPGFMRTKMTQGMPLSGPLTVSAEEAAKSIYKAWIKGRDVTYVPGIWRYIMRVIRNIPEFVFKETNI
jgi:decaprenylphospho-beta-D-erythro-pentofuranosid-2-ulose 2-reductase